MVAGLRSWFFSRKKHLREFEPRNVIVIDAAENIGEPEKLALISAIAFNEAGCTFEFLDAKRPPPESGIRSSLEFLKNLSPGGYLIAGHRRSDDLKSALDILDIPHIKLEQIEYQPSALSDFDEKQRVKLREFTQRRAVLYVNFPKLEWHQPVFEGFLIARRSHPDLLLACSGISETAIQQIMPELNCCRPKDSKARREIADVMLLGESETPEHWLQFASVALIGGDSVNLEEQTRSVIGSGAALVVYDYPLDSAPALSELASRGAIWHVQVGGLLGAAITQALEPEKAALTTLQGNEYFSAQTQVMSETIAEFCEEVSA